MLEFIYDRTEEDVSFAKNNQDNILNLKGSLNAIDLNRIANNLIELNVELKKDGFYSNQINKNNWIENIDIPTLDDYNNIRTNLNNSYKCLNENHIPFQYKNSLDYIEVNNWEFSEKNGFDLINNMRNSYNICGEFFSGE